MQLAAIDIGTNSLHMIVVKVRADLSFEVVDREKEMVRLGAGGLEGRALTEEAMQAALQTLSKFKRLAVSHKVDRIVAAATSAVREAANGGEFLVAVARQTGIRARVISGTEEARLIHLAAVYGLGLAGQEVVSLDIGGGSVEISRGAGWKVESGQSFKLGVLRLTERFVRTDPISSQDERRLTRHIDAVAGPYVKRLAKSGFDRVVGTSGTILSLGTVATTEQDGVPPAALRNRRISAKQIRRLRKRLTSIDLEARVKVPGLDPRRGDLAVAGAVLLDAIVHRLGAEEITLCDLSLREGLILDYIARHRKEIAQADRYPDVRRRSVNELAERCRYARKHARQVAALSLALFDRTTRSHRLTANEREWLEYAALLHDIGVHISYERHPRHSWYLIRNGDLRGFEPHEIDIIALVARYHRRATPSRRHEGFSELSKAHRRTVRALGAILRLAEALDRSHAQTISGIEFHDREDDALLQLQTKGDAELELWAATRHLSPFERMLGKPLRVEVSRQTYGEQPDDTARIPRQAVRRRGHRRLRQDDTARPVGEVADRGRPPRVRHRMELVGARKGRHEDR
jgi:exopolyphosphatase/guanosine-5'-triphosphate,3'-diphosphate pyrophosphatase